MRKMAEIFLSDNGKELFIYDGNGELVSVERAGNGFNTESFSDSVFFAVAETLGENE